MRPKGILGVSVVSYLVCPSVRLLVSDPRTTEQFSFVFKVKT